MCGIGGWYKGSVGGKTPIDQINSLWCSLEDRGIHAAGVVIGWGGADKPISKKKAVRASKASNMLDSARGSNTQYVLLHTRFTTQGSTKNNGNNHPVIAHGITLTHNGMLSNDTRIFNQLGVKRLYDVDTEAINAALSKKSPKWMIENIQGSMSLAWVETNEEVNKVHLLTNGKNPLVIGRTKSGDIVWGSTMRHLEDSGFEFSKTFNALPYKLYTISEGGRINSRWVSKKRSAPAYNRQIHSSQKKVSYQSFWDEYGWESYETGKKASKTASKAQKVQILANETEWVEIPSEMMGRIVSMMEDYGYGLGYDSHGNKRFVDRWEGEY